MYHKICIRVFITSSIILILLSRVNPRCIVHNSSFSYVSGHCSRTWQINLHLINCPIVNKCYNRCLSYGRRGAVVMISFYNNLTHLDFSNFMIYCLTLVSCFNQAQNSRNEGEACAVLQGKRSS